LQCTMWRPARPALFPYTTLFRSWCHAGAAGYEHALTFVGNSAKNIVQDKVIRRLQFSNLVRYSMPFFIALDSKLHVVVIGKARRSEEHTSELQSRENLVCRLLLE